MHFFFFSFSCVSLFLARSFKNRTKHTTFPFNNVFINSLLLQVSLSAIQFRVIISFTYIFFALAHSLAVPPMYVCPVVNVHRLWIVWAVSEEISTTIAVVKTKIGFVHGRPYCIVCMVCTVQTDPLMIIADLLPARVGVHVSRVKANTKMAVRCNRKIWILR